MKKVVISTIILTAIVTAGVSFKMNVNSTKTAATKNTETKAKMSASYKYISGLEELKNSADTIIEAEGTDQYELIDYKGVTHRKTIVKVLDVIKGDKQLKEIKFLQTEGLEGDEPPVKGEKMLMFLRKGVDNPDSYVTFGGTQGIYKIVESNNTIQSIDGSSTNKNNKVNKQIKAHSMINDKILKDLNGNYDDVKKKLSE